MNFKYTHNRNNDEANTLSSCLKSYNSFIRKASTLECNGFIIEEKHTVQILQNMHSKLRYFIEMKQTKSIKSKMMFDFVLNATEKRLREKKRASLSRYFYDILVMSNHPYKKSFKWDAAVVRFGTHHLSPKCTLQSIFEIWIRKYWITNNMER